MAETDPNKLWRYAGLGMEFAGAIIGATIVGLIIDSQAGTAPWGVLVGLLLGTIGGLYLFITHALRALRDSQQQPAQPTDPTRQP